MLCIYVFNADADAVAADRSTAVAAAAAADMELWGLAIDHSTSAVAKRKKNRSSAPLKNRVNALAFLIVGCDYRLFVHSQAWGIVHSQACGIGWSLSSLWNRSICKEISVSLRNSTQGPVGCYEKYQKVPKLHGHCTCEYWGRNPTNQYPNPKKPYSMLFARSQNEKEFERLGSGWEHPTVKRESSNRHPMVSPTRWLVL